MNGAMKMIANAFEGNYQMLARYIPALRTAKTEAEKMAILQEAMASGFQMATAEGETFGGRLEQLNNAQGDFLETLGQITATIGKPFIEGMIEATTGVTDFMNSMIKNDPISQTEKERDTFNALIMTLLDVNTTQDKRKESIERLKKEYPKYLENINIEKASAEDLYKLLDKTNKSYQQKISYMILDDKQLKLVQENSKSQAEADIKLITLREKMSKAMNDYGISLEKIDMTKSYYQQVKQIQQLAVISTSYDRYGNSLGALSIAEEQYRLANEKAINIKQKNSEAIRLLNEVMKQYKQGLNEIMDPQDDFTTSLNKTKGVVIDFVAEFDNMAKTYQEKSEEIIDIVFSTYNQINNDVQSFMDDIGGLVTDQARYEYDVWKYASDEKIKLWEDTRDKRLETIQSEYDTAKALLDEQREADLITQEEYNLQVEALNQNKKDKEIESQKKYNDKINAMKDKQKKKENEMLKKQFEQEKAFKIAKIWMDLASATMGFWSAYSSIPFAGPIIAGVMSAVATGIAIAQTVLVAQQQFIPQAEEGGTVSRTGLIRTDEIGGEIKKYPRGTLVIPADVSKQIARNIDTSTPKNEFNVSFKGATISNQMDLEYITDYVIRRLGNELRLVT